MHKRQARETAEVKCRETEVRGLLSLHGGHSLPACTHADGALAEIVEVAVARGLSCYAVTEHAPKSREADLDEDDLAAGVGPDDSFEAFRVLAEETFPYVQSRYGDRLVLLWGMETDVTPADSFVQRMKMLAERFQPRFLVGSLHHVSDFPIDASRSAYLAAERAHGDAEMLQLAYFRQQAQLLQELRPEVVGHFDLIRKFRPIQKSAAVAAAIRSNLECIADLGLLLEINGSLPRDAPGSEPNPDRGILHKARALGVKVTLGDDAHGPEQVAGGLGDCLAAARDSGFDEIWGLKNDSNGRLRPARWVQL